MFHSSLNHFLPFILVFNVASLHVDYDEFAYACTPDHGYNISCSSYCSTNYTCEVWFEERPVPDDLVVSFDGMKPTSHTGVNSSLIVYKLDNSNYQRCHRIDFKLTEGNHSDCERVFYLADIDIPCPPGLNILSVNSTSVELEILHGACTEIGVFVIIEVVDVEFGIVIKIENYTSVNYFSIIGVHSLYPFRHYRFDVRLHRTFDTRSDLWSPNGSVEASTLSSVPFKPKIFPCGFEIRSRHFSDSKTKTFNVILFWQETPVFEHGNTNFEYVLVPSDSKVLESDKNGLLKPTLEPLNLKIYDNKSLTCGQQPWVEMELTVYFHQKNLSFFIFGHNRGGYSEHSDPLEIVLEPSKDNVEIPIILRSSVLRLGNEFLVFWELSSSSQAQSGYLYWCNTINQDCRNGMSITKLNLSKGQFSIKIDNQLLRKRFGLLVVSEQDSRYFGDGVAWIPCETIKEKDNLELHVDLNYPSPTSIALNGTFKACQTHPQDLGTQVINYSIEICPRGQPTKYCRNIFKNGSFPGSPVEVDDLWNGHIYTINIVTLNKNSVSEHVNLMGTLVPVTALTEIHTSWFEDTHLCIAFIPNLTEVDNYFSSFSICQVRIEKEITMSSPCSPSKESGLAGIQILIVRFLLEVSFNIKTQLFQPLNRNPNLELRICLENKCSEWSKKVPIMMPPKIVSGVRVDEIPPASIVVSWFNNHDADKWEIKVMNATTGLTVYNEETNDTYNEDHPNVRVDFLPLCSLNLNEFPYRVQIRGLRTVLGRVLDGNWSRPISTNYLCRHVDFFISDVTSGIMLGVVVLALLALTIVISHRMLRTQKRFRGFRIRRWEDHANDFNLEGINTNERPRVNVKIITVNPNDNVNGVTKQSLGVQVEPEVCVGYKDFNFSPILNESIDDEDFNISHLSEDTSYDSSQLYEHGDLRQSLDMFLESCRRGPATTSTPKQGSSDPSACG